MGVQDEDGQPQRFRTPWLNQEPSRGSRWIPVVVAQLIQLPFLLWLLLAVRGGLPVIVSLAAFAASYLLLLSPRWPGPTVVAVAIVCAPALLALRFGPPVAVVPLAFAVIAATVRGARAWAWGTVGIAAVAAVLFGLTDTGRGIVLRLVITLLLLCLLIGLGEAIRNRRIRFDEYRAQLSRRRQTEAERERLRIARELHDVLAHSLSSINVQAAVGLHLIRERPAQAAEALASIKETSKSALDEVRGVLGFLRSDADDAAPLLPDPQLSRLPGLTEGMASLGIAVDLHDELPVGLPGAIQRTVYRLVQESLTNISRHSDASRATVSLTLDHDAVLLEVVDDGTTRDYEPVEGRGIVGMRERAQLLGGDLTAGAMDDGGFRVFARLPLPAEPDA